MDKGTSKYIAAAAMTAAVGAFGMGAFALAQGDPSFNPQDFASAYSRGNEDAQQGYRANPVDADADANRNKENADKHDKSTDGQQKSQDAFSSAPQEGPSGTTAYNITGNAAQGGIAIANGNGAGGPGSGNGNSAAQATAPVVSPTGSGNGGAGNGGGSAGNNGNAGGSTQPPAPLPTPWQPTYIEPVKPELPSDPMIPKKPNLMGGDPINNSNKNLTDIDRSLVSVTIWQTSSTEYQLYADQTLDDWTVFCGLEAYFSYIVYDDGMPEIQTAEWRCSREQFDEYQKQYFKIVSRPDVAPNEPFPITVAYRITPNDPWTEETVTYYPTESRTYVLGTTLDESGNSSILFSYPDNDVNLFSCNNSLLRKAGYLQGDGTLTKLLLSWQENGQDVDFFYQPTGIGRHLISPGRFVDVPDGFTVKLNNVWMVPGYTVVSVSDLDGKPCLLQTLTAVSPSASCMLLPDRYGRITLSTSPGIQAIDIEAEPVSVDRLEVSDSVWYINMDNGRLRVEDGFSVDKGNPNYASLSNGILANKQESEYLGIPLGFKTLEVPEGIENVNFTEGNSLERVTLDASDPDKIPSANWENLRNCNIVVDDAVFNEFSDGHKDILDISTGNTVSMKSNPNAKYRYSNDALITDGKAVHFADTGIDLVRVVGAHTLTAGCLENCPSISTIVLADDDPCFFENGCLAGSSVRTIVCSTDEQYDHVISRLQASGASDDVYVTVAVTSDEGYRYFDNIDDLGMPAITMFEAPESTRTFNGVGHVGGYPLAFSAIAPGTFQNHSNLTWVNLANSIDHIGASAFAGCSNLQGVFISNENMVTVGGNAFVDCASMRFVASNAVTGIFASDEKPNASCLMYAPTNCLGYHQNFISFDEQSNVAKYAVDEQEDGSLVLSGCDAEDSEWLLLAAGNEMNGDLKLSPDVIEIFSSAFANCKGTFTINWDELPNLQYIDAAAFANSGVAGDVYVGSMTAWRGVLGEQAFSSCPNITSFTSETGFFQIGDLAFEDCTSLERVTLGAMGSNDNDIRPGLFSNCPKLQDITFTGYSPVSLTMFGTAGMPFLFDSQRTFEEEEATLRLNVPDYAADSYLESWLYAMVGSGDYKSYYKSIYKQLLEENDDIVPDDVVVRQRMSENLLRAENHLRTMMSLPLVEESSFLKVKESNGYTFVLQDGKYALINAPADATVVDFGKIIPEGIDTVGIDAKAFADCENLKQVILTDKVDFIYNNAFAKCDGVTIELPETVSAQLVGGSRYYPFTFGSNVKLKVPEGAEGDYLAAWPMQGVGVENPWGMYDFAEEVLNSGWVGYNRELPSFEEYYEAVNNPLMEQENYLRGLMGLEPIESLDQLAFSYDPTDVYEWYQMWYVPQPEPELPDFPEFPEFPDWGDEYLLAAKGPESPVADDGDAAGEVAGADAVDAGKAVVGTAAGDAPGDTNAAAGGSAAGSAAAGSASGSEQPAPQASPLTDTRRKSAETCDLPVG